MSTPDTGARNVDRQLLIESIVIMIFAAAMFAVTFTFHKVPAILAQGIQPTAYPRAVLIIMFLLAALQAVKATRLTAEDFALLTHPKPMKPVVFITVGMLIVFLLLMPILGTFLTVALFCPALALLWGERRWLLMGLSFAGFLVFLYLLFRVVMNVPLP